MGKFTLIPENAFQTMQMGAGVLVRGFEPNNATISAADIIGATTGGFKFSAVPSFTDMGEDVDNCPKNMAELKRLDGWEIRMTGNFVSADINAVAGLMAAADVSGTTVTPRQNLTADDFEDLWWVGDYSDENTGTNAGYIAIHMKRVLNVGGFQIQTSDRGKGQFAFDYLAHYSITEQDVVPVEVYVKAGTAA